MPDTDLPQWDMTTIFPSLESSEFTEAFDRATADIAALATLFDRYNVRRREPAPAAAPPPPVQRQPGINHPITRRPMSSAIHAPEHRLPIPEHRDPNAEHRTASSEQGANASERRAPASERQFMETPGPALVDQSWAAIYEEVTGELNKLREQTKTLGSYINCFTSTDASNDTAQARDSLLDMNSVTLDNLYTRYIAWVGSSDVDTLLQLSPVAQAHEFGVRRAQLLEKRQMPEGEETLAAALRPSGINGWARLHGAMTALLTVSVPIDGEPQTLPMSSVRALANNPDRTVRQAAYESEIKAWESVSVPLSAALNGIKGFQQTLRSRRGWRDDVEPTLLSNSIDRPTLEAMQAACVESFPDFRRYMTAKARVLGLDHLAWYDLGAPIGKHQKTWTWPAAEDFIRHNFSRYSERLGEFAGEAFRQRWVDAEPHVGKEGGAYCTHIRPGESRIMMNFDGSFNGVSTLAHELGHAYHNLNLKDRTPLQSGTPSTLAETASIFCETLTFDAALEGAGREERLALLDTSLQGNLMVVVDIHSRFLFESGVFTRRASRDLTVHELNELMLQTQRETYGPHLDPLHPYMWAVKGHYYGPTFYNYPYTFGLLFGLGLYRRYQQDPQSFRSQYDDFLSSTGLADARTLARRFEVDVTQIDFWRSSLDVIRRQIGEFERLASTRDVAL
ncbi:MAG: M3 family oligoendopeptidase [Armatimonadota bacterium]|nr:M3 family oligoendopeptidase [Armatimonadota bacterium]